MANVLKMILATPARVQPRKDENVLKRMLVSENNEKEMVQLLGRISGKLDLLPKTTALGGG